MQFKSLTPILFVEAIEPCLEFWKKLEFKQLRRFRKETGWVL